MAEYLHTMLRITDPETTPARTSSAALAELNGQGIEPEREPYRVREGGSRICFVRDPDS
jgi:hypothetical protein